MQISEYYHDIGYPFKVEFLDVGHAVDDCELKKLSPFTLVALTAMKYIWNAEQFTVSFRDAALHLLRMQNTDEGRDFIKQSLSYFFWKWPYKSEDIKMDRPEIMANKGYESFGEHFFNEGVKKERERNEALDAKRVDYLRSIGVSEENIATMLALK